jgi:hypothetical protein
MQNTSTRRPPSVLLAVLLAALLAALLIGCSPRFNWREVRSNEGGFVVALPDKPQTVTRKLTVAGHAVDMTMVSTGVGATVFAVGFARVPDELRSSAEAREATLAYFRDGLVRNIEGQLMATAPTTMRRAAGPVVAQQLTARGRIAASGRAAQLVARLALVDDRLYQVVAIGAEGELPADVLETFFTSFQIGG